MSVVAWSGVGKLSLFGNPIIRRIAELANWRNFHNSDVLFTRPNQDSHILLMMEGQVQVRQKCPGPGPDRTSDSLLPALPAEESTFVVVLLPLALVRFVIDSYNAVVYHTVFLATLNQTVPCQVHDLL
jgi:hypothetical protein